MNLNMMAKNEKCDFDTINLRSNGPTPCTLDFDIMDAKSTGIRINMPTKAKIDFGIKSKQLGRDSRVPLCLVMQFPQSEVLDIDLMQDHVSVVMKNVATGQSITNSLVSGRMRAPKRNQPITPMNSEDKKAFDKEVESRVARYYINVNLADYLTIPAVKATYQVCALFKTHKSNVVTIELR